ncbi:glycosyltransferase family 2 protein [Altererythrobacter sp.]|uniref:glycosyltransferase family 2 protein n=1 Tax=Altererythrobacter sp. TaxID=1872480 RepID=UPI003D02327E
MNSASAANRRAGGESGISAEVTVVIVSYNTCALTLKALETLFAHAGDIAMRVIVWDNASEDGSAEAIAQKFPQVELVAHDENIGFARANNAVAERVKSEWLLLLNPDTETQDAAIAKLVAFGIANPRAGIFGGRTVFPDGSLNMASCWNRITPWSQFCSAVGLTRLFPRSCIFNPEAIGCWRRDSEREVDIVVGCFFLIRTDLWRELGGFDPRYFMYGEEADLCLRARKRGYRPMITPDAQIMHLVGASTPLQYRKKISVMRARSTLIRDHWHPALRPLGIALAWLWAANRMAAFSLLAVIPHYRTAKAGFAEVWRERGSWLAGY